MKQFNKLIKIMKRLRNPINGCPWDRKQTGESLREYILEEAYELVEAIEMGSPSKQKEELGDLLLQIVFLSRINQEAGHFAIEDVIETISDKLIKRHPHIFGDLEVQSALAQFDRGRLAHRDIDTQDDRGGGDGDLNSDMSDGGGDFF